MRHQYKIKVVKIFIDDDSYDSKTSVKGTVFFRQVKSGFWLCENGHFWCKTAPVRKLLSLYFTYAFHISNFIEKKTSPSARGYRQAGFHYHMFTYQAYQIYLDDMHGYGIYELQVQGEEAACTATSFFFRGVLSPDLIPPGQLGICATPTPRFGVGPFCEIAICKTLGFR